MTDDPMQQRLDAIDAKLAAILEEIDLQRRRRREMEDLKEDLTRVGKDLYETAVEELDQVHDQVQTRDIFHLGKKLLRNVPNLTKTFEQLENLEDFVRDFSPISREMFIDFLHRLDEIDRKGYFGFARELRRGLDNVVSSFSVEDARALSDNLVTILSTVKNLTQPGMLSSLNNALQVYQQLDIRVEEEVSLISLLRELNTPEVKRGLAFAIRFLKNVANLPEIESIHGTPTH
jgi:uncharacterized protein YjgD (DUF1641 family)